MIKIKDKKVLIFYFLMGLIFLDFGMRIKNLSYQPIFLNIDNPVFKIVHVNNTGSAFNLFENHTIFLATFGILALLAISLYVLNDLSFKKDKFALFSITIFSGGALGNLIERIQSGYVVDYIKLNFINFPVFNAFDIMISAGVVFYTVFVLFEDYLNKIKKNNENR